MTTAPRRRTGWDRLPPAYRVITRRRYGITPMEFNAWHAMMAAHLLEIPPRRRFRWRPTALQRGVFVALAIIAGVVLLGEAVVWALRIYLAAMLALVAR